ncbi:uncharacterized protein LOC119721524 [Patiria miniata]|uniref:Uncharacterized protein n=1 Tax=Patiria miniata TaxID=46514 RepID=A0A913Z754_PATMI|nr:uncharacterized protein LOC119721524 [Patiria miniata]
MMDEIRTKVWLCVVLIASRPCSGVSLRNCEEIQSAGFTDDGEYLIVPDGFQQGEGMFWVRCERTDAGMLTVIHHDHESPRLVGETDPYIETLTYGGDKGSPSIQQFASLIATSRSCEQSFTMKCLGTDIWSEDFKETVTVQWRSRQGDLVWDWGVSEGMGCKCNYTGELVLKLNEYNYDV